MEENFRVEQREGDGYFNGCIPLTIYWVQKRKEHFICQDTWKDIKGFEDEDKANELLELLQDGDY